MENITVAVCRGHRPDNHLSLGLPSLSFAKTLSPKLVAAAQAEYDKWDESDEDTYAGGGICHLIAEELVKVLDEAGIEASSVSSTHEQHVYVACQLAEGVVTLDIPYCLYEVGALFTWTKIQGVQFDEHSLVWLKVDPDPEMYKRYIEY
jgi:hypothetical protein